MFLEVAETTENTGVQIDWNEVLNTIINWCMTTGLKFVIGLIVVFILFKLINLITKKIYKRLQRRKRDETLSKVGTSVLRISLKVLVFVGFIAYIGIETASISALIAAAGVGVSLALQGSLSNFAGGIIIIVMRPFKLGDFITTNGQSGTVEDIRMFYTVIITPDNKMVYVPNGSLANNVIVNVSGKATRRVDITMSIAYSADLDEAKKLILAVCDRNEKIFKDPIPYIAINQFASSSVELVVRVWCESAEYWPIYNYLNEEIKKTFDQNAIEIPFPQLEVKMK